MVCGWVRRGSGRLAKDVQRDKGTRLDRRLPCWNGGFREGIRESSKGGIDAASVVQLERKATSLGLLGIISLQTEGSLSNIKHCDSVLPSEFGHASSPNVRLQAALAFYQTC